MGSLTLDRLPIMANFDGSVEKARWARMSSCYACIANQIATGVLNVVARLLELDAGPNSINSKGQATLMIAADRKFADADRGVDVDVGRPDK